MNGNNFSHLGEAEKINLYRKEVSPYASEGKIPPLARFRLDLLRKKMDIDIEVTQTIENEIFAPFFQYQENLKVFKQAVLCEIGENFHISKESHRELEKLRLQIGIKLEDAKRIFAENCIEKPSIISPLIIRFHKFKIFILNLFSFLFEKLINLPFYFLSSARKYFLKAVLVFVVVASSYLLAVKLIFPPIIPEPVPPIIPEPILINQLNNIRFIKTLEVSQNLISSISGSPNDSKIAIATYNPLSWFTGKDNTVKLLSNLNKGSEIINLSVHDGWVNSVVFSPTGSLLASASDDKTIRIWDIASNTKIATLINSSAVKSLSFSPDGSLLASLSQDKEISIWSVTGKRNHLIYDSHVGPLAFSLDGLRLASGGNDGVINIYDLGNSPSLSKYLVYKYSLLGHIKGVKAISFSPNGKLLASGSLDDTVKVWDVQTGRELRSFTGHTGDVNSVIFSADNEFVISGSSDGTIKIWNINDGSVSTSKVGRKITSITFGKDNSDNEVIISAGLGKIDVWRPEYLPKKLS